MLAIHPQARTTPAVRAEIARAPESSGVLAKRYGVSTETIRKWRKPRGGPDATGLSGTGAAKRPDPCASRPPPPPPPDHPGTGSRSEPRSFHPTCQSSAKAASDQVASYPAAAR